MIKELQRLLELHGERNVKLNITTGKAVNVKDNKCDVQREGLAEYKDVWLNVIEETDSFLTIVPKVNSVVLVVVPDGQVKKQAMVIGCSEVEKVICKIGKMEFEMTAEGFVFNEGSNKGLIIVDKLKTEIEKLNTAIETLKAATQTGLVAVDSIVPGTSAAFVGTTGTIQKADLSEVTNEKIKH